MRKFFVVSDIHSDYKDLKVALTRAGYDKRNKDHILIVIGDVFDRFNETVKVYNFLKSCVKSRLVLIKGNHESLYFDLLNKSFPECHDFHNGTVRTFCNIAGYDEEVLSINYWVTQAKKDKVDEWQYEGKPYEYWDEIRDRVRAHEITNWLRSNQWKDYYEADNFIFTHSFLPLESEDGCEAASTFTCIAEELEGYKVPEDWRSYSSSQWEESRWGCPWAKYQAGLFEVEEAKGKTLVVGHWHSSDFYKHLKNIHYSGSDIYYSKGLIGIDGGIHSDIYTDELVHLQNVLIIENGICYNTFGIKLAEPKAVPIIKTVTE